MNRYRTEARNGLVRSPTPALCGESDAFSPPDPTKITDSVPGARAAVLPGTGVPAVGHRPERFAPTVRDFPRDACPCPKPSGEAPTGPAGPHHRP